MDPEQMSERIVYNYERALTTTVNDIEHIESISQNGTAVWSAEHLLGALEKQAIRAERVLGAPVLQRLR